MNTTTKNLEIPKAAVEATMLSFCLGKVMLQNCAIAQHEMNLLMPKADKRTRVKIKEKQQELIALQRAFNAMFKGADKFQTSAEAEHVTKAIEGLLDGVWTRKRDIDANNAGRPEMLFKIPSTAEEL